MGAAEMVVGWEPLQESLTCFVGESPCYVKSFIVVIRRRESFRGSQCDVRSFIAEMRGRGSFRGSSCDVRPFIAEIRGRGSFRGSRCDVRPFIAEMRGRKSTRDVRKANITDMINISHTSNQILE